MPKNIFHITLIYVVSHSGLKLFYRPKGFTTACKKSFPLTNSNCLFKKRKSKSAYFCYKERKILCFTLSHVTLGQLKYCCSLTLVYRTVYCVFAHHRGSSVANESRCRAQGSLLFDTRRIQPEGNQVEGQQDGQVHGHDQASPY